MKRILLVVILLAGCGGSEFDQEPQQAVQVTATVPYASESVQDIIDREKEHPLPPRGDWEAPCHSIENGRGIITKGR